MSIVSPVPVSHLERHGRRLKRPECVLCASSGDVFVPEWPGGVTVVRANGAQHTWRANTAIDLRPNGIALMPDGSFLIANLGDDGGVWRLAQDGSLTPFVVEVDGVPLPPANFVTIDARGRAWISVSTRRVPRQQAWRPDVAEGFIVLADDRGARIVADGLHYTNEVRPDPSGRWLYFVETFGRRVRRCAIDSAGDLGLPEAVLTLGHGCFPDGFAFDAAGRIWMTSLISNRLLCWDGARLHVVVEDLNTDFVSEAERAFVEGRMRAEHLGPIPGTEIQHLTSVAFGDADLRTVYLGVLHGDHVYRFRGDIVGAPPVHWDYGAP